MHYRLLSVSKYGIKRDYTINFKEIDTPTEKERAEINEIKARTDAMYIDAGILTQDEVRDNLIKSPNSDYADISNDIDEDYSEEENNPDVEGGSSNEQSFFAKDDDDTEFRTTENGVKFPIKEGETTKESCEEFFKDKEQHEKDMKHSFESQKSDLETMDIDKTEYSSVVHGINKIYEANKHKKQIKYYTMNYIYKVDNHGFNNYKFRDKMVNEETDRN